MSLRIPPRCVPQKQAVQQEQYKRSCLPRFASSSASRSAEQLAAGAGPVGASVVHNGVRWTSGVMRCDTMRACFVQRAPGAVLCGSSPVRAAGRLPALSLCVLRANRGTPALRHRGFLPRPAHHSRRRCTYTVHPSQLQPVNSSFTRCAGLLTLDPIIACNGAGLDPGQMLARPPRERAVGGQKGSRSGFCADSRRGASRSRRSSLSRTSSASSPTSTRQ